MIIAYDILFKEYFLCIYFSWFARTDTSLSESQRSEAAQNLIREFYALLLNAVSLIQLLSCYSFRGQIKGAWLVHRS